MKKIILAFAILLFTSITTWAQTPNQFNYQGVARSSTGTPLANTTISLQLSIIDGGTTIYQENHTGIMTNAFGLFNVAVGGGTPVTGTFTSIVWGTGNKYMQVGIDITGGSTFTPLGTPSQLLSVPYALYAATGGNTYTAGTGINVTGAIITNAAPDQTVTLTAGTGISTSGTYPNFTIANTSPSSGGTVTNIATSTGLLGGPATTTATFQIDSSIVPKWDDTLADNLKLITLAKLNSFGFGTPAGSIMAYGGSIAPAGWLLCNGAAYGTTAYPALFAAIGTNYGGSGGIFNVPDFRGVFLRGVDGSANNDPDHASRTAMSTGGNTGNNLGSVQTDASQGHWHDTYMGSWYTAGGPTSPGGAMANNALQPSAPLSSGPNTLNPWRAATMISDGVNGTPRISSETRPKNAYVNYIIKY